MGAGPPKNSPRPADGSAALPWATCLILALAGLALWRPAFDAALIYDRSLILSGQIWRCWSGHTVHWGGNHFFWDMVIFVPAGCWLERWWPRITRWFFLTCPLAISIVLLAMDPELQRYAGISGVAAGVLVLLAGLQLRRLPSEPKWFWIAILGLVGAKVIFELIGGAPYLTDLPHSVRVVPLAHISGIACGLVLLTVGRDKVSRTGG